MPSVYVGTYSKYNRGSIGGAWLDLEDYGDKDEFMKARQELHADEYDPEFMFQNYEGIPSQFITECSVKAEFWDYMYSTVNEEVKAAYMELFGEWNLMTWAKWFEATKDRHVADEKIGDVRVSTVFFGG